MQPTSNKFSSPKKPPTQNECIDEWAKIDQLRRQKPSNKTEEQRLIDLEQFEQSEFSDLSSDSQTELPIERLNSTPKSSKLNNEPTLRAHPAKPGRVPARLKGLSRKNKRNTASRPQIAMEPFNMREERDNHFIDSKGNFLYKNYRAHNDAWLLSLDEEVADPQILKDRRKTYEFALQKKISRVQSEDSSVKSIEDPMTSESFKERKIETLKSTLLNLLESGESANRAINRLHKLLPGKKSFKPYKRNIRKNTKGESRFWLIKRPNRAKTEKLLQIRQKKKK